MHYNVHRDYDPPVGRYLQSDPLGLAAGVDTFGYVGGRPLSLTDRFGLANSGSWHQTPLTPEECRKLRDDIYRKNDLLRNELLKYDPIGDGKGGFPMKYGSGFTRPGGHYDEIKDLQRGIKRDLERYNRRCCGRGDGDGNPPITRNVDELANSPVDKPIFANNPDAPFIMLPPGGNFGPGSNQPLWSPRPVWVP